MKFLTIIALTITIPNVALAQFVPTLGGNTLRICPDRPSEPGWVENIGVRESYKVLLLRVMYRAQSMQQIADTGDCSCETRFPSWDTVNVYYLEHYADIPFEERWKFTELRAEYNQTANEYRRISMPICQEQGKW